jgi:hypothetical protein
MIKSLTIVFSLLFNIVIELKNDEINMEHQVILYFVHKHQIHALNRYYRATI